MKTYGSILRSDWGGGEGIQRVDHFIVLRIIPIHKHFGTETYTVRIESCLLLVILC